MVMTSAEPLLPPAPVPPMQRLALNDARESENRIHSDEVAARYGFRGALVSGVNVFGHLSQPLVRVYGEDWLSAGLMDVLFLKPAYEDNLLRIETENMGQESTQRSHLTCAYNETGQLLAKLDSWLPAELPPVSALASLPGGPERPREELCFEQIPLEQPAPIFHWSPTEADNQQHIAVQGDQSPIYHGSNALLHPCLLLDACNKALMRMFILPAWIHTGSRLVLREPLRVGQDITINCIPIDKWERKGHRFIKLYIAMKVENRVVLEVQHTAIIDIAI